MGRRFYILMLSAVVTLIVWGGAVVSTQGPRPGGPRGAGPGPGRGGFGAGLLLRDLNLTDAQREQVRQLTEQHREQTRALVDSLMKAQEAQRQAIETVPADEARIRAAMQELAQAQTEIAVDRAQLQSEIYALLTPEQQQAVAKRRAERDARVKERQGRLQQRLQRRQVRPQV